MTREEAIEVLKHTEGNIKHDKNRDEIYFTHEWVGAYEMAIAALREQPQWISVEERLPSGWWIEPGTGYGEPEEYIVFVKGAILPTFANFIEGRFVSPNAIYREDGSGFADDITHWMPLPEGPEVEV